MSCVINVEPSLQLRSLTDTEISSIMKDYQQEFWSPDFPGSTSIAEMEISTPVWEGLGNLPESKQKFDNILKSLRILKDSDVIYKTIYTRRKYRGSINYGYGGGWSGNPGQSFLLNRVCAIKQNEINDLLKYYRAFANGNLPDNLKRSLHRFNFAIERDLPEDKLIDALISLEALYGDGSGAIGYKIALRASVFLEDEFEARCSINDYIKESYDIRNAIAHGKSTISMLKKYNVERLITLARRSIRKSMDLFIRENRGLDAKSIDDLLLK